MVGAYDFIPLHVPHAQRAAPVHAQIPGGYHAHTCPVHDQVNVKQPGLDGCAGNIRAEQDRMPVASEDLPVTGAEGAVPWPGNSGSGQHIWSSTPRPVILSGRWNREYIMFRT